MKHKKEPIVKRLFHGSKQESLELIAVQGFNRNFAADANGTLLRFNYILQCIPCLSSRSISFIIYQNTVSVFFQLLAMVGECTLQWNLPTLPKTSIQYLTRVASGTCLCVV